MLDDVSCDLHFPAPKVHLLLLPVVTILLTRDQPIFAEATAFHKASPFYSTIAEFTL